MCKYLKQHHTLFQFDLCIFFLCIGELYKLNCPRLKPLYQNYFFFFVDFFLGDCFFLGVCFFLGDFFLGDFFLGVSVFFIFFKFRAPVKPSQFSQLTQSLQSLQLTQSLQSIQFSHFLQSLQSEQSLQSIHFLQQLHILQLLQHKASKECIGDYYSRCYENTNGIIKTEGGFK